jgi:methionine synthase II (cobalamin-independent)
VGSLSRPVDLIQMYREQAPAAKLASRLMSTVDEVVGQQVEAGIDIVNDGEFGKPMSDEVDYAAWAFYIYQRLSGFEMRDQPAGGSNLNRIMQASNRPFGFRGVLRERRSLERAPERVRFR